MNYVNPTMKTPPDLLKLHPQVKSKLQADLKFCMLFLINHHQQISPIQLFNQLRTAKLDFFKLQAAFDMFVRKLHAQNLVEYFYDDYRYYLGLTQRGLGTLDAMYPNEF